jgi:hypothetical protein
MSTQNYDEWVIKPDEADKRILPRFIVRLRCKARLAELNPLPSGEVGFKNFAEF